MCSCSLTVLGHDWYYALRMCFLFIYERSFISSRVISILRLLAFQYTKPNLKLISTSNLTTHSNRYKQQYKYAAFQNVSFMSRLILKLFSLHFNWIYYSNSHFNISTNLTISASICFQEFKLNEVLVYTYWNHIQMYWKRKKVSLCRGLFSVILWIPSQHHVTEFNGALNSSCPILNTVTL